MTQFLPANGRKPGASILPAAVAAHRDVDLSCHRLGVRLGDHLHPVAARLPGKETSGEFAVRVLRPCTPLLPAGLTRSGSRIVQLLLGAGGEAHRLIAVRPCVFDSAPEAFRVIDEKEGTSIPGLDGDHSFAPVAGHGDRLEGAPWLPSAA